MMTGIENARYGAEGKLESFDVPGIGHFYRKGYGPAGNRRLTDTWYLAFNHNGQHRIPLGTTDPKEAIKFGRKERKKRVGKVERHELAGPAENRVKAETLIALVEQDYRDKQQKSLKRVQEEAIHLLEKFKGWKATEITYQDLADYRKERENGIDPRKKQPPSQETIRKELGVLRRGYRLAVMKLRFSPYYVPVFPEFPASAPRTGYVVESEMMRIIEATKQTVLKLLFFFAYLTSYRKSEILNLQWNQVNWETGELWLRKGETKNGEARCFPFGVLPELKELLEKQRAITDECQQRLDIIIPWVFHREGKQIREFRRAWKTAVKNAGLTPRLFHDLRRSATRYLVKAGIPSKTAQMITGHKDRGVFEKYNIVDNPDLAEGIQRYAEYREKLKAEAQKKVAVGSFGT